MSSLTERERIVQKAACKVYTQISELVSQAVIDNCKSGSEQSYFMDNLLNRLNICCGLARATGKTHSQTMKEKNESP